jgi:hypothetical protein
MRIFPGRFTPSTSPALACRKNLGKTRATMLFSRFRHSGLSAKIRPLLAGMLGVLSVACSDDEAPSPAGNGGGGNTPENTGGALRGDGLDSTPESDLDRRTLRPPSDRDINDALDDLLGLGGGAGGPGEPADAAAPDGAAPDATTPDGGSTTLEGGADASPDATLPDVGTPPDPPGDAASVDTGIPA